MFAKNDDAGRGGFGATFAKAYALCLQTVPTAQRLDDVQDIREKAISLAAYARRAGNSEAERQAEQIRALAERRIQQLLGEAEMVTRPAMLAPTLRNDVRGSQGGKARAARLTPEHRSAIARRAATERWKTTA
jgi:hypothetical protein